LALYGTINVRVPENVYRKTEELAKRYGSRTAVIIAAVNSLHAQRKKETPPPAAEEVDKAAAEKVTSSSPRAGKGYFTKTEAGRAASNRIEELYAEGKGIQETADILNSEGFKTSNGQPWERGSVYSRLKVMGLKGNA
jgi:Arc/MetJ-type ribon-helix-helix transcriptional regulator